MPEYLVTDARTLAETWVAAPSATAALRLHEGLRRGVTGEVPLRPRSKPSHDGMGSVISMALGGSFIRGRREWVVRETAGAGGGE